MSQSQNALGVGLSGLIGLALDADLSRSEIADELRRAAELLSPSQRVRFAMAGGERMSIDPTLDEPMPMREAMPLDPRQDGEFGAGAFSQVLIAVKPAMNDWSDEETEPCRPISAIAPSIRPHAMVRRRNRRAADRGPPQLLQGREVD